MGTKEKLIKRIDEDVLSCVICMERFTPSGRKVAKLLSCSHTFCGGSPILAFINSLSLSFFTQIVSMARYAQQPLISSVLYVGE